MTQVPLPGPGHVERCGAKRPGEQQAEGGEQRRAPDPVQPPGQPVVREPGAERLAEALHRHRQRGAEQQPGEDGDQRRIGRLATPGQQRGAEPTPDCRADHEARQGKAACDQAALVADRRKGQREDHDDQVDDVHLDVPHRH